MLQTQDLKKASSIRSAFLGEVGRILSNEKTTELLLITLAAGGHILLEDVSGTGKTLLARASAQSFGLAYRRIQMSADLMPGDLLGWERYSRDNILEYQPGPIFCNVLLANQINWAPPRLQAALFEVMEEGNVTVQGVSYPQMRPFTVFAARTPPRGDNSDYPLVGDLLDRFLMRISLDHPEFALEVALLLADNADEALLADTAPVGSLTDLLNLQALVRLVGVSQQAAEAIVRLAVETRQGRRTREYVSQGISSRGCLMLKRACQAKALLEGRASIALADVQHLAVPVLSHRLVLNFNAEAEGIKPEEVLDRVSREVFQN